MIFQRNKEGTGHNQIGVLFMPKREHGNKLLRGR